MAGDYRLTEHDEMMAQFEAFWDEETQDDELHDDPEIKNLAFVSYCAGYQKGEGINRWKTMI